MLTALFLPAAHSGGRSTSHFCKEEEEDKDTYTIPPSGGGVTPPPKVAVELLPRQNLVEWRWRNGSTATPKGCPGMLECCSGDARMLSDVRGCLYIFYYCNDMSGLYSR